MRRTLTVVLAAWLAGCTGVISDPGASGPGAAAGAGWHHERHRRTVRPRPTYGAGVLVRSGCATGGAAFAAPVANPAREHAAICRSPCAAQRRERHLDQSQLAICSISRRSAHAGARRLEGRVRAHRPVDSANPDRRDLFDSKRHRSRAHLEPEPHRDHDGQLRHRRFHRQRSGVSRSVHRQVGSAGHACTAEPRGHRVLRGRRGQRAGEPWGGRRRDHRHPQCARDALSGGARNRGLEADQRAFAVRDRGAPHLPFLARAARRRAVDRRTERIASHPERL